VGADHLTGAEKKGNGWVAGGCLGLLLIVMKWIIPENSLRSLAPVVVIEG